MSTIPRGVLWRWLSGALLRHVAITAGVLSMLLLVLALLEQASPILSRHLGLAGLLIFSGLHLPALLANALPLSALIAGLLLLTRMTTQSEIAILRAAGLSAVGLYRAMLPAIAVLSLLCLVLQDQVVPRSELALDAWWNVHAPGVPLLGGGDQDVWLRAGDLLIHGTGVRDGGRELLAPATYARDERGVLTTALRANAARWQDGGWRLEGVQELVSAPGGVRWQAMPDRDAGWDRRLTPERLLALSQPGLPLPARALLAQLHAHAPRGTPPASDRTSLWLRATLPLDFATLLLIALPVIYIPARAGTRSWVPVGCLGAGLAFVIVQGLLRALGDAGSIPAWFATLPVLGVASLLAAWAVLRLEER